MFINCNASDRQNNLTNWIYTESTKKAPTGVEKNTQKNQKLLNDQNKEIIRAID